MGSKIRERKNQRLTEEERRKRGGRKKEEMKLGGKEMSVGDESKDLK